MIVKPFDLEDVFTMSEIIDKMGLDADVRNVISQVNVSKLENADDAKALGKEVAIGIGIDLISKFIRNLHKAKNEVKKLIGDMSGKNPDEVSKLSMKDMKEFFSELLGDKEFIDFLKQQGQSIVQK
jgi:hypothetical protein